MKYSIVFSSQTGNTRLLAETLQEILPQEDLVYFGEPSDEALVADRIYAGFWTDKGSCDAKSADFLKRINKQEVFLFGTAGFGENPSYFEKILKKTRSYLGNQVTVIGSYMCQGKMPMSVRERYMKMKEQQIKIPNLDGLIANFDRALSHPNEKDLQELKECVRCTK